MPILSSADALCLLSYEPEDGVLRWAVDRVNNKGRVLAKAGDVAGWLSVRGYLWVSINDKDYPQHRVIWLMMTGAWPINQIDHINGDKTDNRWINLRDVTQNINQQNRTRASKKSVSGMIGAYFNKGTGKYVSHITTNGERKHLGYFNTAEEAHHAYMNAKAALHAVSEEQIRRIQA